MSEEKKEVALYSLPSAPVELEAAFISDDYIERLIESIRTKAKSVVGDLNTVKGRRVYISMASDVRSSKAAIDEAGKSLVAEMKKRPAMVDASRRKIREALDELAVEIRKPVTDYEAEQERIKEEEAARIAAEKLAAEIESAHEMALLMNKEFDREAAEAKEEAERQRIAHEKEIKRQAIEQARQEAEAQAKRDRDAAAQREAQLIAQAAQEKADRIAAQERAEREAKEAQERTERLAKEAREQAEREKQQAIELAQRKAQEEADRIKRQTEQKEAARLAEEKRIADEAAKRAANEAHRKAIGTDVVKGLVENAGLTREQAISTLKALMSNSIPHTSITY